MEIINDYENIVLMAWDEFYQGIKEKVIGFPIWVDWFKESCELYNFLSGNLILLRKQKIIS